MNFFYFEYNVPIVTNTVTTTIAILEKQDFEFSNYFSLYPNPTTSFINLNLKNNIEVSSINICNTLGQVVLIIPNAKQVRTVDVSALTRGNCFIKLNTNKGSTVAQFIKE
ncbi:MAG TPA: T9SS type A sorting domain-containing protein [Flavobacterium sp.]|nr:T9SS type A sorting domain-containing protein [Flavobacterium sp.]